MGMSPPGVGRQKIKSASMGLNTRASSDSQNTGHNGEPGEAFRSTLSGRSENWSVFDEGSTRIKKAG